MEVGSAQARQGLATLGNRYIRTPEEACPLTLPENVRERVFDLIGNRSIDLTGRCLGVFFALHGQWTGSLPELGKLLGTDQQTAGLQVHRLKELGLISWESARRGLHATVRCYTWEGE